MIPVITGDQALQWAEQHPKKPPFEDKNTQNLVRDIISMVRKQGDDALTDLAARFGDPAPRPLVDNDLQHAMREITPEARAIVDKAAANIRHYNQAIVDQLKPITLERDGYTLGLDFRPVDSVGCYVPAGRHPLPSTALMTAITAQVAGVQRIVMVSPRFQPATIYAGLLAGVETFIEVGGAQSIAALAYGTPMIPKVDMVVGPGNVFVTEAKKQLQGVMGIDMLAGPSEVGIIADSGANPDWVAWDMLAQAEHDPQALAYLWTNDAALAQQVLAALQQALAHLDVPNTTNTAIKTALSNSAIVVLPTLSACVEVSNAIAPEHLELQVAHPAQIKPHLKHYGAVFMGYAATAAFGDYMAGPNHTLPTGGTARFSSLLTPMTFIRAQSSMAITGPTATLAPLAQATADFAGLEGLLAHQQAAACRLT
jgi:histidinol dehydrogenase